jgi:hypothetical protein
MEVMTFEAAVVSSEKLRLRADGQILLEVGANVSLQGSGIGETPAWFTTRVSFITC